VVSDISNCLTFPATVTATRMVCSQDIICSIFSIFIPKISIQCFVTFYDLLEASIRTYGIGYSKLTFPATVTATRVLYSQDIICSIFSALIFSIFMLKISIQYFVIFCNIYKNFIKDNSIIFVTLNILNFDFFSDNTANDNPRNDTSNIFPFFPFISPVFLFNVLQHLVTHNTCNISLYFITFSDACRYRIFQTT